MLAMYRYVYINTFNPAEINSGWGSNKTSDSYIAIKLMCQKIGSISKSGKTSIPAKFSSLQDYWVAVLKETLDQNDSE